MQDISFSKDNVCYHKGINANIRYFVRRNPCPSIDEWITRGTHTHTNTYTMDLSTTKKNEILPFTTLMDKEGIVPSEISQTNKQTNAI